MPSNTIARTQTVSEIGSQAVSGRIRMYIPELSNKTDIFQSFNFTIDCEGNMHTTYLSGARYKSFGPNDLIHYLADA